MLQFHSAFNRDQNYKFLNPQEVLFLIFLMAT